MNEKKEEENWLTRGREERVRGGDWGYENDEKEEKERGLWLGGVDLFKENKKCYCSVVGFA